VSTALEEYDAAGDLLGRAISAKVKAHAAPVEVAELQLSRGNVLSRIAGAGSEAAAELGRAASTARVVGRTDLLVKARTTLATLYGSREQIPKGAKVLDQLLDELGPNPSEHRLAAHRLKAKLWFGHTPGRAVDALDDAVREATALGDARAELESRMERHTLQLGFGRAPTDSFALLGALAEQVGDAALTNELRIKEAAALVATGEPVLAETTAQQVRQSALEQRDPLAYFQACALIAEARHLADDRIGVLSILLTCRATLREDISEEAAQPAEQLLASLETRWGPEGLKKALEDYQAEG